MYFYINHLLKFKVTNMYYPQSKSHRKVCNNALNYLCNKLGDEGLKNFYNECQKQYANLYEDYDRNCQMDGSGELGSIIYETYRKDFERYEEVANILGKELNKRKLAYYTTWGTLQFNEDKLTQSPDDELPF